MLSLEAVDRPLLERTFDASVLAQGLPLSAQVYEPQRVGSTLSGRVGHIRAEHAVVTVLPQRINTGCTCGSYSSCRHAAALLLCWLREPRTFSPPRQPVEPSSLATRPAPALTESYRPKELPGWMTQTHEERQDAALLWLASQLADHFRLQDMRRYAAAHGWRVRGAGKDEVALQMAQRLADRERLQAAVSALQPELHLLLACLLLDAGTSPAPVPLADLASALGERLPRLDLQAAGQVLWAAGLVGPNVQIGQTGPRVPSVPWAMAYSLLPVVHTYLAGSQAAERDLTIKAASPFPLLQAVGDLLQRLEHDPAPLRPPMPRPMLEQSQSCLRHWDYDPVELLPLQDLQQTHYRLEQPLTVPPPPLLLADEPHWELAAAVGSSERLQFLIALMQDLGLLQPGTPATVWPQVREAFLSRHPLLQRAILARAYLGTERYHEFWELLRAQEAGPEEDRLWLQRMPIYYGFSPRDLSADLVQLRRLVLRLLACLPQDRWLAVGTFEAVLRPLLRRFASCRHDPYGAHNGGPWRVARGPHRVELDTSTQEGWKLVQGRLLRAILTGPLHWLGFADLAWKGAELATVRLRGWAELFWLEEDAPAAHGTTTDTVHSPQLEVDGDCLHVYPARISPEAYHYLSRFCRLGGSSGERYDYRPDAQAAYQLFQAGVSLPTLLAEWPRHFASPVPACIEGPLARWWAAYGRVRLYRDLAVVELADDCALAEMRAVSRLDEYLVAEISPRLIVIREDAVSSLIAEMRAAGYTPRVVEDVS